MPPKKSTRELPPTLKISQVSQLLGVTPMTLRRWDKAGILKPTRLKPQGNRLYKKSDILKILDQGLTNK